MNRRTLAAALLLAGGFTVGFACAQEKICHGPACHPCPPEGCPSSAGVIHRSVGPGSTAPVASGEGNPLVKIEGSVATFEAPLPDRVGVGDALVTTFGQATTVAFITLRRSSIAYELQTADGGVPPDAKGPPTSWRIYRAYTSLSDAAAFTPNEGIPAAVASFDAALRASGKDLVALGKIWSIACYADAVDSADERDAFFERWNTSADDYLRIFAPVASTEVGTSQRHEGVLDPARYMLRKSADRANGWEGMLSVMTQHARIEGLQLVDDATNSEDLLLGIEPTGPGVIRVGGNLLFGDPRNAKFTTGILPYGGEAGGAASIVVVHDNVIAGMSGIGLLANVPEDNPWDGGFMVQLYGNTVHGSPTALETGHARVVAVNNALDPTARCVNEEMQLLDPSSDHNLCSRNERVTGASSRASVTPQWVNPEGGDFHLSPLDMVAAGRGADLSAVASYLAYDVDGHLRGGAWDIGADQR